MSVARGTVHSIQFLRFVAASAVVLYHSHLTYVARLVPGGATMADYWFHFGAVGVHVFFVISGYIMYLTNFARPGPFSTPRFLVRRLIRIYPTYWTFVLLYLAADAALGVVPVLRADQAVGMLALAPWGAPLVIGPAWTLSFEVFFYLVFGLVMTLGERRGTVALTVLFVFSVAAGILLRPANPFLSLASNALLLEFVAGVWIARATARRAFPRPVGWSSLALAAAGFGAGLAWGYDRLPSAIAWGVPSALLIAGAVILEQTGAPDRRGLVRRLSWLGDSSYSLYLCHILLITLAATALEALAWVPPLTLLVPVTAVACVTAAALFYHYVERPVVGALHRRVEPPRPRSAEPA